MVHVSSKTFSLWRHQTETFYALLVLCAGSSPVTDEFPSQRPVIRIFDVFFDLRLNKRLSKQSWRWWFKTPSRSFWRHCNVLQVLRHEIIFCRSLVSLWMLGVFSWFWIMMIMRWHSKLYVKPTYRKHGSLKCSVDYPHQEQQYRKRFSLMTLS